MSDANWDAIKVSDYSNECNKLAEDSLVKSNRIERLTRELASTNDELNKLKEELHHYKNKQSTISNDVIRQFDSRDSKTVTLPGGGKQSETFCRMDLIDSFAILSLASVLKEGCDKYGEDNWRSISVADHINKALIHLYMFLAGDKGDDHLEHAFTRLMMAVAIKGETQ